MLKVKHWLFVLKITVVILVLIYLINTGSLNVSKLVIFIEKPWLFFKLFFSILLFLSLLVVIRWWLLLRSLGVEVRLSRLYLISWIGQFFSIFLPGSVSVDGVKAFYLLKENGTKGKTRPLTSMVMDRIIGLFSIVLLAMIALLSNYDFVSGNSILMWLLMSTGAVFVCLVLFFTACIIPLGKKDRLLIKLLSWLPFRKLSIKIFEVFKLYSKQKKVLFYSLFFSLAVQIGIIFIFYEITKILYGVEMPVWAFFFIVPIGELTTAIPIAPAGIGVGHLAFDSLYRIMGQDGGADVFNIFTVVRLVVGILGGIPYLLYKERVQTKMIDSGEYSFSESEMNKE